MRRLICVVLVLASLAFTTPSVEIGGGTDLGPLIMSYNGGRMSDGAEVPMIDILEHLTDMAPPWPHRYEDVRGHLRYMRDRLGVSIVRFILHTHQPQWADVGMDFPQPRTEEVANLAAFIDLAAEENLAVMPVWVLAPAEVLEAQPDQHAAILQFWDATFGDVISPRSDDVAWVDVLGDFDPLNVYAFRDAEGLEAHRDWWRWMWPTFTGRYPALADKAMFEVIGGVDNPAECVRNELTWARNEILANGWPEPTRYGFEAYSSWYWLDTFPTWADGFAYTYAEAAAVVGGYDRILVEEIGNRLFEGDAANDGQEGARMFQAAIDGLQAGMPIGVWSYDLTEWGVRGTDGERVLACEYAACFVDTFVFLPVIAR